MSKLANLLSAYLHGALCVAVLWIAVAVTACVLIISPMRIVVLILLVVLVIVIVVHLVVLDCLQTVTLGRRGRESQKCQGM